MEFYKILREIMEERQLTVAQVARQCGLSDSTVRSIFDRKQKKIALEVAFKLSEGLHVSLERLNGMEDKEIKKENSISSEDKKYIEKIKSLSPEKLQLLDIFLKGLEEGNQ